MNNLWKTGTKKAYYGYIVQLIISLVGGLIVSLATLGSAAKALSTGEVSFSVLPLLVGLVSIAAYVYYFLGINDMKKSAASTSVEEGTSRLFIGVILSICGSLLGLIPVIAIVGTLVSLAGFIVTWLGYSSIKIKAVDANAKFGGTKLSTSALLSVIAIVTAIIPIVGWIATIILEIIALVFAIQGWKALANSELA